MPAAAMLPLAARLRGAGYAIRLYGYRGRGPFEANVERFAHFAREETAGAPAHFIGHSLGGVLILDALSRHPELRVASALLLGAPARGCLAGRRFARSGFGRWMLGASRERMLERDASWRRPEPLGVVAGTRALGLGAALEGGLPGENDGVVQVVETAVEGATARALVPIGHSLLIASRGVARLAAGFLRAGRFE
jgi:pimeloyl-ACP methyl ester carboxylesterase